MFSDIKALDYTSIRERYENVHAFLNERARRIWAGSEALVLGYGGITAVSKATGLSARTIKSGIVELETGVPSPDDLQKQRKPGAGRKKLTQKQPKLAEALEHLLEPYTSGDPMRPLKWTCKSTETLALELRRQGFTISADSVGRMLKDLGYSLQSNRKRFEGTQHPDRDAQFKYINKSVEAFQSRGCPVISVDIKKKELVGNSKNAGREWTAKG